MRSAYWRVLLALVFAGTMVLAGLSSATRAAGPRSPAYVPNSQTLVVAYSAAPADLDPATSYDGAGAAIFRAEYDTLVRMKGTSTTKLEGDLATSWSATKNNKVWTFKLRHNVHFHDGTLFTAQAAKDWLDHLLTVNQGPAFIVGTFVTPAGIKAVNQYTLQFTLKFGSDIFPRALASQWANAIASPKVLKMPQTKLHEWFQTHEDGTGPYKLQTIVPDQSVTMVKFPGYWGGWSGKHVSKIIFSIVTADATRRELVEKGDADIAQALTPNDLVAMKSEPNLRIQDSYGMKNIALVMTVAGPLKSAGARRAMSYAFDYNGYINGVLKGYGKEAQGPLPRTILGHDSSLPLYKTNLTQAKSLLAKAGVKSGTKMTMWYQAQDETTRNAALVMQAQLAQIGIQLTLVSQSSSAFIGMYYGNTPAAQRPNFFVWYWWPDYNDAGDWLYPQFDSSEWGSKGSNGGFYKNATVDKLLTQAAKTSQTAPRDKLYATIQKILAWTDPASVFVADLPESTVYRKTLHGYYLNPVYTETYNFYAMWK